jgi:Protein of unknown function (DUF2867)
MYDTKLILVTGATGYVSGPLCSGIGMCRGRPDSEALRVGDPPDFWRLEMVEPGRLIRLRAEMKVPGRAWLEFKARPQPD